MFPHITPAPEFTPSTVVQRMQEYKKELITRDADTIFQMGNQWLKLETALEASIELLVMELVDAGVDVTTASVYKLNRYQKLVAQVRDELRIYDRWATKYISQNQATMAVLGIDNAVDALTFTLLEAGSMAFFDKIPVSAVEFMIGNAGKGGPVYTLLETAYPAMVDQMTDALIRNVALGIGPVATAKEMVAGLGVGLDHALTVATTEQLRVYREASRVQYESSGAVKGYKRFASKSGNTCALCFALDGEVYPTKELMSVHPRDRCTMIPLVRGVDEPQWESGEDWLRKQDPELQQKVLGNKATELWNNGDIELIDLVNKTEHPIWGPSLQRTPLDDLGVDLSKEINN